MYYVIIEEVRFEYQKIVGPVPRTGCIGLDCPFTQKKKKLKEALTPEELKWVEKSEMAEDIKNYFGKDYSCAESLLMVSLRFMKKPEDLVWAAAGFGGGIYHKNLCGFLTAGVMAIGFASGELEKERKEEKAHCKKLVNEYWKWWDSLAPLHCSEIRKLGTSSKVCMRLGQLAAAKIEELITP
ncbi:MAG: C-GCAxxG-C-C family (seleno)protein [Candidatus Aminicenantaceae bacterium]